MRSDAASTTNTPDRPAARLAGWLYLGTIVFGLAADVGARGALVDPHDAASTARAIAAHEGLYRAGLGADLAMLACYVAATGLFLRLFWPVGRNLALVATLFSVTGISVLAANGVTALAPLELLSGPLANGLPAAERSNLALAALALHGDGYDVALVFFGAYCAMLGVLIARCRFLPRWLGGLMVVAGAAYLLGALADLLVPSIAAPTSVAMLVGLAGEAALAAWLILVGPRSGAFESRAAQASAA